MILSSYQSLVESDLAQGRPILPPRDAGELRWLIDTHPDLARPFLPPRSELARLGLSRLSCRAVPPFAVEFRERLLATLVVDRDFAAALQSVLGGAA